MSNHAQEWSDEDDNGLMTALAAGDDDALSEIMSRWQAPMIRYLYRTVGNYEVAVDLALEVFVRLYRNRSRYRAKGSFSSYLFTIATNLAKNHFRWKSRHPESPLDGEWARQRESREPHPIIYLEKTEESARVRKAILQLPESLRVPLVLFYYEDLSQSRIAMILHCSEKTVETRIYRARKKLKSLLENDS